MPIIFYWFTQTNLLILIIKFKKNLLFNFKSVDLLSDIRGNK